jgi:extracellular elastinolytic metalloproteinase
MKGYLNGTPTNVVVIDAPLNVLNVTGNNLVKIYPNPASTQVNVETTEKATIELMDAEGRVVYFKSDATANEKHEIDTQNLASGVYMIKIYTDSFVVVKKVVINK